MRVSTIAFRLINVGSRERRMVGKATHRSARRATRNLTQKHALRFNKDMVHVDRKKEEKAGYQKHKEANDT